MKVTPELVDRLARLSRLEFRKEEMEEIRQDLEKMIDFIDKLNELDTSGVEPLVHLSHGQSHLREDMAGAMADPSDALKNASATKDGFFTVPAAVKKPGS